MSASTATQPATQPAMLPDALREALRDAQAQVNSLVLGKPQQVRLAFVALLADGHLLIEDLPGLGKTTLAHAMAATLGLGFSRVQFTSDLLPADILGVSIYEAQTRNFEFHPGPVFAHILLADEINRAPPKTQSALLQAMNERAVTIDDKTHSLGHEFFVIATQNPIEQHGTYPLPEAQLDRFLFKLIVDFPDRDAEIAILSRGTLRPVGEDATPLTSVMTREALQQGHALVDAIRLDATIVQYIVDLTRATRSDGEVLHGVSTRAAAALAGAVRARAALDGRDYALPDDVQALFLPAMRHRIVLGPTAEIDGRSPDDVLTAILNRQDAPR